MSYDYNRPYDGFFYTLWVSDQNLNYEITRVAPAHLTHRMEGIWQPLPVLIDDVLPNPPLDPKPNEPQLIPGPEDALSNQVRHNDVVPETEPEPVP